MSSYTKEQLLELLGQFEERHDKMPTRREMRAEFGVTEDPFMRVFGGWSAAKEEYLGKKFRGTEGKWSTTLVVPDAHVSPGQNFRRFEKAGRLIAERRPDRIVLMGDWTNMDSLSNWDLTKSGLMEGRRYVEDMTAAKEALGLLLNPMKEIRGYNPQVVYIIGNHELRGERYLETRPELKEHINLIKDLGLKEFGITDIVPYRENIEIEGTLFTHAPQNAANQPVTGKYAIHRAAEQTAKSVVFAHTHRKEGVNYYRHGGDTIIQVNTFGAFFEHTDAYAYGGLNAYWRGLAILTHWAPGRYDVEEIALERLLQMY